MSGALRSIPNTFGRALRESGQALDRLGCTIEGTEIFRSTLSRHRSVMAVGVDHAPSVSAVNTFIAPNASVVGSVSVAEGASVWYGTVLRADQEGASMTVGKNSNVQDRSVLSGNVAIGASVTIGHGALIADGVTVGDHCLIGQGSNIGAGCTVESKSILAAGAVLLPGAVVPSGQLWAGNPAKYTRDCKPEETATFEKQAQHYVELAAQHAKEF